MKADPHMPGCGLTFVDFFCGAGGSSTGLVEAGLTLVSAYNHWDRAIETHATNHRHADHVQADISNYDMRLVPRNIDVAWMSPECTWHSPAGGRRNPRQPALDLFDEYVPNDAGQRSRMTMWDVVRAAEARRFPIVIVENVMEVTHWELFQAWMTAMDNLGYRCETLSVSAAHIGGPGNPYAPQWRDRVYFIFVRAGVPVPDVRPRPEAWCPQCDTVVRATQVWKKPGQRFGKYGPQYYYACTEGAHRPAQVEPFASPAADAIDWADLGTRIGDRPRPLAEATLRRIRVGARMFAGETNVVAHSGHTWDAAKPAHPAFGDPSAYYRVLPVRGAPLMTRSGAPGDGIATPPFMVSVNHGGADARAFRPDQGPLPTRSTKVGDGLVMPFITELYGTGTAKSVQNPLGAVTAGGNHQGLAVPPGAFIQKHHGGVDYPRVEHMLKPITEPLPTVVARPNVSLVVPVRKRPTVDMDDLESMDVSDYRFRMLSWREHATAQRFPVDYEFTGNSSENTMMAGNAVASNVAHYLGAKVVEALCGVPR